MNDYFVNEKLFREFKEITAPVNLREPVPEKFDKLKKSPNYSSMQISNNATYKKELSELDHKFKNLEKAYNKLNKKNNETQDEIKQLKYTNESLVKELNIIQISNEKILGEKINLENMLEENKNYTRKLESRLVQGAKNQYLIEINNKLRKEVEEIKKLNEDKISDFEKMRIEISKKNQEIKILNKALDIRTDEFKFRSDVKSSLLYDVGMVKQELDEYKEKLENEQENNELLKKDLDDKISKIQELNFAKAHLAELLIENENKSHNLEVEKDSYEKHCFELKEERNMLRDYIDKITSDFSQTKETYEEENKTLSEKLKEAETFLMKKEETIKKLSIELESLKMNNNTNTSKIKNLENTLKIKINECNEIEARNAELKSSNTSLEETKTELEKEIQFLKENINNLNKQIQTIESDNFELMKKNKNLLISQETFQTDLVKQNQHLQNVEIKLKEQISKNNAELEKIKEERENFKKMTNEAISKCSSLIKEKSDLEKELNKKNLQIENLKNTNILLHKNFSNKIKDKEKETFTSEDEKIIKIGESKVEENSMINLIRREKEKNKEFIEEIKKIKNNLNY